MSIWSRMKAAFSRKADAPAPIAEVGKSVDVTMHRRQGGKSMLAAKMQAAQQLVVPDPPYRRSTTALRRFRRDADRKYNHVSMEVDHHDQHVVDVMGYRWWRNRYRDGHLRGTTYNVGVKAEKRRLKSLGLNKRQLRAALRVFRAQLVAQGVK